jgi:toxin ParE1/3/4
MAYRVELTDRAAQDLRHLYRIINAEHSAQARIWFNRLEQAILSLDEYPTRCPVIPEDPNLRHLLYGRRREVYRVIFAIHDTAGCVSVLHIRHSARDKYQPDDEG